MQQASFVLVVEIFVATHAAACAGVVVAAAFPDDGVSLAQRRPQLSGRAVMDLGQLYPILQI